jgi:hypothetical protein
MKKKNKKNPKIDENELLKVIDIITKKLAYKFKFGYHDIEDMKQQISIFAIEGLKNYDHQRPLENFLWTHVRNRLFNYKRDNYQRPDKPCYSCPLYDKVSTLCTKYINKYDCDLYQSWADRNSHKKNLMHLTTIDEVKDYGNVFIDSSICLENIELLEFLDENLIGEYRVIYLKIKAGDKVPKSDIVKLSNKVKELIDIQED